MIRHVVMWNFLAFADGRPKVENVRTIHDALAALPSEIPEIKIWEVGINALDQGDAYDLVLMGGFESWEDLAVYQNHPAHVRVRDEIRKVRLNRRVVDYEIPAA